MLVDSKDKESREDDDGALDKFGFDLLYAIKNNILEEKGFPFARLDRDGSLVIMCEKGKEKKFNALLPIFNERCEAHGVQALPGKDFSSRTEISRPGLRV